MTMPGRIRVWKNSDNIWSSHGLNESFGETPYVRADIAADLARELQRATDYGWIHTDALKALDNYEKAIGANISE